VVFNLCCLAYSIFEISQIRTALWLSAEKHFFVSTDIAMHFNDTVKPYLIVVVVILALTQILCTWFAYQLFQEFGWKIYKKIGADPNMKSKSADRTLFFWGLLTHRDEKQKFFNLGRTNGQND